MPPLPTLLSVEWSTDSLEEPNDSYQSSPAPYKSSNVIENNLFQSSAALRDAILV